MTTTEYEKDSKRRILELKSRYESYLDILESVEGEKPKSMRERLKAFLGTITDWKDAYSIEELATVFYDISYGKEVGDYSDAERWQRYQAMLKIRNMIARIRAQSEGTVPVSIPQKDEDGRKHWRVINPQRQSQVNKRLAATEVVIVGIDRQDRHIEEVYATGHRARREATINERTRRRKKGVKN